MLKCLEPGAAIDLDAGVPLPQSKRNVPTGPPPEGTLSALQSAPLSQSPGVDFDLFLLKTGTTPLYIFSSQSVNDNREGFDITLASSGNYEIWLSWPDDTSGSAGCGTTQEGNAFYADVR